MAQEGTGALGKQWDGPGPHAVVHTTDDVYEVQARQRALLPVAENREAMFAGAPVKRLDPKKVLPTQQFLYRSKADPIAKADPADLPPVDVVRMGGQHYVLDGHHRWADAHDAGRKLDARVIDYRPARRR